ncbi:hypothetical protein VTN77DRAFT_8757 [Rasamsonia byssochlamydoides]|uniref:uncharacterized protein n=1 Tax=Rasamsonia byssochlamydoides TaxID=89139 RepID=UPI0037437916
MSTTTTAVSATSTPANCGAQLYEIPTTDAACAVPAQGNYSDVMHQCCGVASVQSYDNNCGLYCLAQGQSVGKLVSCLTEHGVGSAHVFCNHNQTATATASATGTKATGESSTASSTSTGSSSTATSSSAAAVAAGVSKSGLGVLALLFCSTLLGAIA